MLNNIQHKQLIMLLIDFKNSLSKSQGHEYLVILRIYNDQDGWHVNLTDYINMGNDKDLYLAEHFELRDEEDVFDIYISIIGFHTMYAKQDNVRIWNWKHIIIPEKVAKRKLTFSMDVTPLQNELIHIALAMLSIYPNKMITHSNLFDALQNKQTKIEDTIMCEYIELIDKIKYCGKIVSSVTKKFEEMAEVSSVIDEMIVNDGLYLVNDIEWLFGTFPIYVRKEDR